MPIDARARARRARAPASLALVVLAGACTTTPKLPARGAKTPAAEISPPKPLLGVRAPQPVHAEDVKAHEGPCRVVLSHPTSVPGIRFVRTYDARGREMTREVIVPRRRQMFANVVCSSRAISTYDAAGALIEIATNRECWNAYTGDVWDEPCSLRIRRDAQSRIREVVYAYTLGGDPERIRVLYDYDERGLRWAQRTYEPNGEIETERFRREGNVTERSITLSFLSSWEDPRARREEQTTRVLYVRDRDGHIARIDEADVNGCKGARYGLTYTYDAAGRLASEDGSMAEWPREAEGSGCEQAHLSPLHTTFNYDEAGRLVRVTGGEVGTTDAGTRPEVRFAADGRVDSLGSPGEETRLEYSGTCPTPVSALLLRPEQYASRRRRQLDLDLDLPPIATIEHLSDTRVYSGIWQFH